MELGRPRAITKLVNFLTGLEDACSECCESQLSLRTTAVWIAVSDDLWAIRPAKWLIREVLDEN
jgi:hypothetical protein